MLVYQRVVRSVAAKYRKLEAGSARNHAYQSIWFGTVYLRRVQWRLEFPPPSTRHGE